MTYTHFHPFGFPSPKVKDVQKVDQKGLKLRLFHKVCQRADFPLGIKGCERIDTEVGQSLKKTSLVIFNKIEDLLFMPKMLSVKGAKANMTTKFRSH